MAFVIGPLISPRSPYCQGLSHRYLGPTSEFWFGTDKFGRDMWTRVWAGTRVSLYIGLLAALLDIFVGVIYGAVSGFLGGRVDDVLQRGVEILNVSLLGDRNTRDGRPRPWDHNHHHCDRFDRLDVHGEDRAWQDAATEKPGVCPRLALSRSKRVQACGST